MTKLDYSKVPESDPARIQPENIPPQMSDRDIDSFKRQLKRKYGRAKIKPGPRRSFAEVVSGVGPKKLGQIGERIKLIRKSGKADADSFIQQTAIMAMQHAEATGDCGHAARLVEALPNSIRANRLAEWISRFSPIVFGKGKKGGIRASIRKEGSPGPTKFNYAGARGTVFR
ncbi:hypothetical protein [Tsuneonella rigui]|uniref:hypothetical protein n=1 Tax=Tsuneonella rigui TaxID=1708790 RepID=UPI000F7DCA4A|nr:hypothetical protein [Tsuneonella rigui]